MPLLVYLIKVKSATDDFLVLEYYATNYSVFDSQIINLFQFREYTQKDPTSSRNRVLILNKLELEPE